MAKELSLLSRGNASHQRMWIGSNVQAMHTVWFRRRNGRLHRCSTRFSEGSVLKQSVCLCPYWLEMFQFQANVKYGAIPKVIGSALFGYIAGRFSYQPICIEKLMNLPGSRFAELLRQNKRCPSNKNSWNDTVTINTDAGVATALSLAPFQSFNDRGSEQQVCLPLRLLIAQLHVFSVWNSRIPWIWTQHDQITMDWMNTGHPRMDPTIWMPS